jgi:protein phosphatase
LTRDHTYAQLLVDIGRMNASDIATSRHRHVLTNALGSENENVLVDIDLLRLADGDRVMLCSDGLTDMIDDDAISRILIGSPGAAHACDRLVQQALENGGRDNVTVIVADYRIPPESGATVSRP